MLYRPFLASKRWRWAGGLPLEPSAQLARPGRGSLPGLDADRSSATVVVAKIWQLNPHRAW